MRAIMAGLALGLILLITGCPQRDLLSNNNSRPPATVPPKAPEPARLVQYLNANADRMSGLQSSVAMDCKQDRQSVGLDGDLAASWPRNFRLMGKALGRPAVDVGSNENEFWFWISENRPPYVYHCSHADLARGGVNLPFPFHPDMVMSALGMAKYDPAKPYQLKESPQFLELIEETTSAQGQPVEKITVFNRMEARPGEPQVVAHKVVDRQGKILCRADIQSVVTSQQTGAILPRVVLLSWPGQRMSMRMTLNNPHVVNFDQQAAGRLFQRTNLTSQAFDLARGVVDGPGLQRTGLR
jgi:hypothetical protein